jgi:2-O-A-mannosyl-D-glycerate-specific PTS system IIC component
MPQLECASVEDAVRTLVNELVAVGDVTDGPGLIDEVMRREVEGTTAIGDGLVIPHARFAGVRRVRLAVATLASALDIPAEDGRPVDVVIVLVGPPDDSRRMLQVLARLARLVKRPPFLDHLRQAGTAAELRRAFETI